MGPGHIVISNELTNTKAKESINSPAIIFSQLINWTHDEIF